MVLSLLLVYRCGDVGDAVPYGRLSAAYRVYVEEA